MLDFVRRLVGGNRGAESTECHVGGKDGRVVLAFPGKGLEFTLAPLLARELGSEMVAIADRIEGRGTT